MSKVPGYTSIRVLIPDLLKADLVREQKQRKQWGHKKLSLADLLVLRAIGNTLPLAHAREIQQRLEQQKDGQLTS